MTDCSQTFLDYDVRTICNEAELPTTFFSLRFIIFSFLHNIFLLFSAWAWPVDPIPIVSIGLKSFARPGSVWPTVLGESHCTKLSS
jgi:hypothetical protein